MSKTNKLTGAKVPLTVDEVNRLAKVLKDEYGIEPAAAAVQMPNVPKATIPDSYAVKKQSISNYRKAGIDITQTDQTTVLIKQVRLINGYILNNKQLYDRARAIFPDNNIKIIPVVYSLDVEEINIAWVNAKMEEFGIHRNDLIKQLAIDKSTLSLYFSGERALTRTTKAAFYYYFLTYQLNRDLREQING